jgi:hypothetical protein
VSYWREPIGVLIQRDKRNYSEDKPLGLVCKKQKVDGYPTWLFPGGEQISGDRPLSVLAEAVGMKDFNEELEQNVPPSLGSASCR